LLDINQIVGHWGYLAIFVFVVLGNMGLPVPEEAILMLAGYLVWEGKLLLPIVLAVGILSAIIGDNLGYWIGRRYGREAIQRYGHWILATPARMEYIEGVVARYGALAVFAARFLPGLRFLAGPTAGATGLRPASFFAANVLGASIYAPVAVGLGYLVAYGLGDYIAPLERLLGQLEHVVLIATIGLTLVYLAWRALRSALRRQEP
jgi:membrane protein DedA with SNARE-associated domain